MEITISHQQGRVPVTIFHITGSLDSSNSQDLTTAARKAVEQDGVEYLLLDLAGCNYMSSAGVRSINDIFLLFRRKFKKEGLAQNARSPHLKLLNPAEKVLEVLVIAGVEIFLETHRDLESALASF